MEERRPWGRAFLWLGFLGPFFFLSYGAATWLAARRADVPAVVFAWESAIPLWPWTIIPYWSIDILYGISLALCATRAELDTHAKRLLTAQILAVTCFILMPLRFTFERPELDGVPGALFALLGEFDKPFNQAPSLHIALLVILWVIYARHVPRWSLWLLHGWFALIGISVLTTWQHHFIDLPTGAWLGFFVLWLWPDSGTMRFTLSQDPRRWRLARWYGAAGLALAALAIWRGGFALWLLWPSGSLLMVALTYTAIGAQAFQKDASGRLNLATRCLFAPYLLGAMINTRLWKGDGRPLAPLGDGVSIGRWPGRDTALSFASIVDLSAELPGRHGTAGYAAVPMLDLATPDPVALRRAALAIEQARASGTVLVCCALGYSRSAAAVATWFLMTRRAASAAEAVALIRCARPHLRLDVAAVDAITTAGSASM